MVMPISVDKAEHYNWGDDCDDCDDCDGWHLVKSAALSVIQERVPPGCCEQSHKHEFAEQFFFVLNGQATLVADSVTHILNPQQGLHVPAGLVH